jgi:hypothetical protein
VTGRFGAGWVTRFARPVRSGNSRRLYCFPQRRAC